MFQFINQFYRPFITLIFTLDNILLSSSTIMATGSCSDGGALKRLNGDVADHGENGPSREGSPLAASNLRP